MFDAGCLDILEYRKRAFIVHRSERVGLNSDSYPKIVAWSGGAGTEKYGESQ